MTIDEALKIYKDCVNNDARCNCDNCQLGIIDGDNEVCRTFIHLESVLKFLKDGKTNDN